MDLLDQLIAKAKAERQASPARKRAAGGLAVDRSAREDLYIPNRLVALINVTECRKCGSLSRALEGIFEERKHPRLSDAHWVRQGILPFTKALPRHREERTVSVPYCEHCADLDSYQPKEAVFNATPKESTPESEDALCPAPGDSSPTEVEVLHPGYSDWGDTGGDERIREPGHLGQA